MKVYSSRAKELYNSGITKKVEIARIIKDEFSLEDDVENIRKNVSRWVSNFDHSALEDACEDFGIPIEKVGHYWYKGKHISIHASNKE